MGLGAPAAGGAFANHTADQAVLALQLFLLHDDFGQRLATLHIGLTTVGRGTPLSEVPGTN